MTEREVRDAIRKWVGDRPLREAGREIGVSATWLCLILKGDRRPSGKILDAIGIERMPLGPTKKGLAFTRK